MLPQDSFRRHFVGPGQAERDRETEEHENNDEAYRPGRNLEDWKGRVRDLDEKPADRGVGHRDFVDVAPLQFGEEVARVHPSSTWAVPLARATLRFFRSADRRGAGPRTGCSFKAP